MMFSLMTMLSAMTLLADELPVTPAPGIDVFEYEGYVEIVVAGDGYVHLFIDGMEVESPYVYPRGEVEQMITITAYAEVDGFAPSETAYMEYIVAPLPPTPMPTIKVVDEPDCVVVSAEGEGEVNLYINGEQVDNPCYWYKNEWGDYLMITATAKMDGYPMSETAEMEYSIPPFPVLLAPEITYVVNDLDVSIYVTGEGYITLYVNDEPVAGDVYVIARGLEDQVVTVYATATADYYLPAESERYDIVIPALPMLEQTEAPYISYEIIDEYSPQALVEITPVEESTLYYRIKYEDSEFTDWMEYGGPISVREVGRYFFEAYAIAYGKEESYHVCLEFTLSEPTPPMPAYDFEVDGIYYIIVGDNKVGVVAYGGPLQGWANYMGDIVIPNQVTYGGLTYNVVEIKDLAFCGCEGVTSVSIGNYVTRIGKEAFYGCTGLTEVTLGDYVISVGDGAFNYCSNLLSVTIGHGVRNIGNDAFAGCNSLTRVICKPAVPPVMAIRGCFDCYETANLIVYPAVLDSYQSTNYWNQFSNITSEDSVSPDTGDVDGDGIIGVNDVTRLIDWILAR